MANFTRVKPLGWNLFDLLASALMNSLDIDHSKAINGDDGSSHAPATQIVIGGSGMKFTGPVAFDTGSGPHVKAGVTLTVDNTALIDLASGGLLRVLVGSALELIGGTVIGHGLIQLLDDVGGSYIDFSGSTANYITLAGVFTRVGAGARAPDRYLALANGATTPIAITTAYDVYEIAQTLTADQVLNVAVGNEPGDRMTFFRARGTGAADAHTCTIHFAGGTPWTLIFGSVCHMSLDVAWNGTDWRPVRGTGPVGVFTVD